MTILVNCPACRHVRQVQDHDVCLGVMCPYCHNAYMDAAHRPLGEFKALRSSLSSSSYTVDLGQWFAYASAHWSSVLGPVIGLLLIEGLACQAIDSFVLFPYVGGLLMLVLSLTVLPPLEAGMIVVTLAQLKGDPWHFRDCFAGFRSRWLGSLIAFTWILFGLSLVILTPVWVPIVVGAVVEAKELIWFGLAAALVFVPLCVYVSVRIGFFGPYLIIDRDFGPVEAIKESWDLTTGHFWGLFGVALVLALMQAGGLLLFGVGLLLVLPLTALVRSSGYLLAGGTRPPMKQPEGA